MSLPRIFMIGWEFPPYNSGGLGTACQGLTSALAGYNVNQLFVLPKQLPVSVDYAEVISSLSPQITFLHINMKLFPYGPLSDDDRLYLQRKYGCISPSMVDQAWEYAEMVGFLAKRYTYGLIHGHDWMTYPAAFAAKKVSGKPVVLHVHSTEFDRTLNGNTNPAISQIEYDHLSQADKIITVSQYTKDIVCDKYSIDPRKIEVVHNGVDLDQQRQISIDQSELEAYAKNRKVVIFMGRLTSQKGPDYFVSIAQRIATQVPNVLFVMAGSGDMYQQVVMQSAQSRLTGKLLYAGFLRNREREFLYRRADLFIMPSVSEPFGIVALEAAGAYTPVIISKQSGVSEVLTSAISRNFWDVSEIADNAVKILKDSHLHSDIASRCAQEAETITWGKAAQKCVGIYCQMCS